MPTLKSGGYAQPNALLHALEMPRAMAEFAAMVGTAGLLLQAPRGDGSHVVVLPGFTASDGCSTLALRSILARLGHRPVAWGLGYNLAPLGRSSMASTRSCVVSTRTTDDRSRSSG